MSGKCPFCGDRVDLLGSGDVELSLCMGCGAEHRLLHNTQTSEVIKPPVKQS